MSVYDPKAIVTLEVTILCGWWAELELPPVKSMTTTDLDGLAGNFRSLQCVWGSWGKGNG